MRGGLPRPACSACGFVFFANMGVGAAVLVTDDAGRVLLVRRGAGHIGAGVWWTTRGYVEWDEDVPAAAAREALEEAGVEVEIGEVVQVATNRHEPERPTVGIWFAARMVDPSARPKAGDDADEVDW